MPLRMRRMKATDLIHLQQANLNCLAENYHLWFWQYHLFLSPQATHVCTNSKGKIIGYVLGKLDDEAKQTKGSEAAPHGGLTSVAVFNSYRKLGIATKLIKYTHRSFQEVFHCKYVDLNVRETNHAGHVLYKKVLGYKFHSAEEGYYADGETGWTLRYTFPETDKAKT